MTLCRASCSATTPWRAAACWAFGQPATWCADAAARGTARSTSAFGDISVIVTTVTSHTSKSGYCFGMRTHARRYCYGVEMQRRQLAEGRMKRLLVGTAIRGSVCMHILARSEEHTSELQSLMRNS